MATTQQEKYPNADIFFISFQENQDFNSNRTSPSSSPLLQKQFNFQKRESNKDLLIRVLKKIQQQYAIFRFFQFGNHNEQIQNNDCYQQYVKNQFQNYKLKKRKLVFGFLAQKPYSGYISSCNYKTIHYQNVPFGYNSQIQIPGIHKLPKRLSRTSTIVDGKVYVNINQTFQQIYAQTIKHFQLDFVWLGVIGRLGTDVQQFRQIIVEQQNFSVEKIGYQDIFFNELERMLAQTKNQITHKQLNNNLVQSLNKATEMHKQYMNKLIESLIRHKFNTRIIIDDIVYQHEYLNLLSSRNYFNLLFIEQGALKRFSNFKNQCKRKYKNLQKNLNLQNFLFIQDFWYRKLIMRAMVHVKFTIQRQNQQEKDESYFRLIKKNYKHIIPQFRPSFDQYFLQVCTALKSRSGCIKEAVGSIIVKNKRIIATGYNGTPLNTINCFNGGCKICNNSQKMLTEVLSCCCIHAEYGCILQAGIKVTPGATLYSTKLPCLWCSKLLVQGKLAKVVYLKSKHQQLQYDNVLLVRQMLKKGNVQLIEFEQSKCEFSLRQI